MSGLGEMLRRERYAFVIMIRAFDTLYQCRGELLDAQVEALRLANRGGDVHGMNTAILESLLCRRSRLSLRRRLQSSCQTLTMPGSQSWIVKPVDIGARLQDLTARIDQSDKDMAGLLAEEVDDSSRQVMEAQPKEVDVLMGALAVRADRLDDTEKEGEAAREDLQGK